MSKLTIGGQAVIEGVMMRSSEKYAIAVRNPKKKIEIKTIPIKKNSWSHIPFIRGVMRFIETLVIGVRSLSFSANVSAGEDEKLNSKELGLTIALSLAMTIVLFYLTPLVLARLITNRTGMYFSIVDGVVRLLIFLGYLIAISFIPDVKRIFQYHGAEHMTVFAYENREKLTVKNIRKYSTLHPRCGTNFILIVFITSVFFFSFIPYENFIERFVWRLALLPIIAAVSYEYLRFAAERFDNPIVRLSILPGLLLQKITTKEPEDDMIKVAVRALKAAV